MTFSDSELGESVLAAESWTEVLALLGYTSPGGYTRQRVRERAKALGLATGHLNGRPGRKRQWSDEDLRQAISRASSWNEVAGSVGGRYPLLRSRATELGIDIAHLERANHLRPYEHSLESPAPDWSRLPVAAEATAVAWYSLRAFDVFVPGIGGKSRVDLIATDGIQTIRFQVKTATQQTRSGWHVNMARGSRSAAGSAAYSPSEIDEFFVMTSGGDLFRIPLSAVPARGRTVVGAKYESFRVEWLS